MAFTNRYSNIIRGALTFTGNTAGLSKFSDQNNQGTVGSIGAFISLNNGLTVGDFPAGTTLNIVDNGSSANLIIPAGSTILHAELIWGGNYFGQDSSTGTIVDISALINDPVQLTTSLGTNSIGIFATAENQSFSLPFISPPDIVPSIAAFYERSADVTSLIAPLGPGTHLISVEEIPGMTEPNDLQVIATNHAGWTLAVAYTNPSLPYRDLNIWAGGIIVSSGGPSVDINVSGFTTPALGPINARLLLSAQEGDASNPGDQVLFGPTAGTLSAVSGPNNLLTNFFASQINNDSGNLDTTGTFGNRNQNPLTSSNISGGRQGWDITNVDISTLMSNNQTSALLRMTTNFDAYMPNTIGIQIDIQEPIMTIAKSADKTLGFKGDRILYTIEIENSGDISTDTFNLMDAAPTGTSIDTGSINIINATGPVINASTSSNININLGPVAVGQVVIVQYEVITTISTPSPVNNNAFGSFSFTPGVGQQPITDTTTSNTVTTDLVVVNINKTVSDTQALVGDVITYTVTIDNTLSAVNLTNIYVYDALQAGTSYVPNSTSIGGGPTINANPSIAPGVFIPIVLAGQLLTVSFDVVINKLPTPNPILNTADVSFLLGNSSVTKTTNQTQVTVVNIDIVKSATPEFIQVGDKITYTSVITNTGQVPIENIIFSDPPPLNTIYDNPSFKINNVLYPTINPSLPVNLFLVAPSLLPLNPGKSITIEYSVTVNILPDMPIIDNTSSIEYSYLDGSILKTDTKESNLVNTVVREGQIILEKFADKEIVLVGDTLTYTIKVENTGNIEVKNVILTDIVPQDTKFVEGSVIVNGIPNIALNPEEGINLGTIQAPLTYIVSFKVTIESLPLSGQIINNASASYEVFVNPDGPPIIENTISNDVITLVELLSVAIAKLCNPKCVSIGDEVDYVFSIVNNGTVDVSSIKLFDEIPAETSFVEGSFVGAQGFVTANDLIEGVDLGNLAAGETKEVSFKVKIDKVICGSNIINKATITYKYTLDNGQTYETSSSTSNECDISIKSSSFKQTFIDALLEIPDVKPDIENIIDVDAQFVCTNSKIIDTPIGISNEGQNLTGKKLVVDGKLCITVTYVAEVETQTVHTAHFEICACEYIVIPNSEDLDCSINPSIYIEDIFFEKINYRQLFINIVFMIESGI